MRAQICRGRDGYYAINCPDAWNDVHFGGFGNTLEEAKEDLREFAREFGYPESEQFEWVYDISAFFYCHPYLRISEVAKRAGVAPAQMRRYACGISMPRPATLRKIFDAINNIGGELSAMRLDPLGIS